MNKVCVSALAVMFAVCAGCAPVAEEVDDSGDALSDSTLDSPVFATVRDGKVLMHSNECAIDTKRPIVTTKNAKVDDAIADALPPVGKATIVADHCKDEKAYGVVYASEYAVRMNSGGVLALSITNCVLFGVYGDSCTLETFNFDLKTGKRLHLSDVLNKAGVEQVRDACNAWFGRTTESSCNDGLLSDEKQYDVRPDGMHFFSIGLPYYPRGMGDIPKGITIPWADLRGGLTGPLTSLGK